MVVYKETESCAKSYGETNSDVKLFYLIKRIERHTVAAGTIEAKSGEEVHGLKTTVSCKTKAEASKGLSNLNYMHGFKDQSPY